MSINDLVPISADSFFVTNDHGSAKLSAKLAEEFILLCKANVVFWNGSTQSASVSFQDLCFGNGINFNPTRNQIYISDSLRKEIIVTKITEKGLSEQYRIDINSGVDNIDVVDDNRFFVTSHPNLLSFMKHAMMKSKSGLEITEVRFSRVGEQEVATQKLILKDDGSAGIEAGSIAAYYKDKKSGREYLLVGTVFEEGFYYCALQ